MFNVSLISKVAIAVAVSLTLFACGGKGSESVRTDPKLDQIVVAARSANPVPALTAAEVGERQITVSAVGVQQQGGTAPVRRDSLWHLGSCAKAFTSTLAAILVERGKLRWNSTLAEVFPELASVMRADYRNVTLEQVLELRSGIIALFDAEAIRGVPVFPGTNSEQRTAFVKWALQLAPDSVPGEYNYSNGSYLVASAMVERAAGMAWEEFARQALFEPLGIRTETPTFPGQGRADQPWGHLVQADGTMVPHDPNNPNEQLPTYMAPMGGLSMTMADYAKFMQMNLRGLRGARTLVSAATMQKLHTPPPGGDYALGWAKRTLNGETFSYYLGSIGTFVAISELHPDQGKAFIAITNAGESEVGIASCETALQSLRTR